ncbi:MAG: bifunctional nuclease family protein [Candidatus Dadabacteria bacterium]|nr:bifunctional nuclease family protein [Candidatus Dadabacteria bacterium]MCY4262443.1 bifunctional nuclease family protein [Candidatus Dadabacteria bacterium]
MFLEMKVSCIVADPFTDMPVVILNDEGGEKSLPLWVGFEEASAIAMEIKKTPRPRPLTHDLLKNVISATGYEVIEIEITELKENTFYARLRIKKDEEEILVDSRPSDAIAIALRTGCRIMVNEDVVKSALSVKVGDKNRSAGEVLEEMPEENFGKYKM